MLVAALVVVAPASAIDPTLVDPTPGIAAAGGIFRDAHGAVWVSDAFAGICRELPQPHDAGAGSVPSPYCDPLAHIGPTRPGQTAFVPLTGDIYVGENDSNNGGVWRLHLNQAVNPSVIDAATKIVDYSVSRDRVFGMSYDAFSDSLDFSTKNSASILRIQHPGPLTCPVTCQPIPLGVAQTNASPSLVHDAQGRLYISGGSSVTVLAPGDALAHPISGLNLGSYRALAFDPNHDGGRLYAGTTNTSGVDWIDVLKLSTLETETYSIGFDGVTAMGVDPASNGPLDVVDDPCVKRTCEDSNRGRRFVVDLEDFAPAPQIVEWPLPISNATVATFGFQYPWWTPFLCSLDQAPAIPCGAGTEGSTMYAGLAGGVHTVVIYAGNAVSGARTIRRFVIDTQAPVVSIDTVTVSGSAVEFGFSANDINVDFSCSLDGGVVAACDDPARYAGLADGLHTFAVRATDFVGNIGQSAGTPFRIGPLPRTVPWTPGKVTSALRKTSLRVAFVAPPGAVFARFTLAVKSGATIRTKIVRVKAGVKNIVIIKLTRGQAMRLQRKPVTLTITAGAGRTALTTKAGRGKLTIATRLTTTTRGH